MGIFLYIRNTTNHMGIFSKTIKRSKTAESNLSEVPGWLKMLQENSWELEILISGGVIFSLFGLSNLVTDFFRNLSNTNAFASQNITYITTMLATKTLTLGFFLHVLLRSFWVSLVALSSMFGEKNSNKSIRYAKPFNSKESFNLPEYIVKLDKLSAWMIYNSFTMAFVLAGWIILLFVLTRLMELASNGMGIFIEPILLGAFVIYLLDYILFSAFRKVPYLSYLLYPVFKVFDLISLRFVYQPGIDYLASHVARWKTALFYICFVICALVFTYLSVQKRMHWPNVFDSRKYKDQLTIDNEFHTRTFYRSSNAEGLERISIQSDIVTEPVLNLFIGYSIRYEEYIDLIKDEDQRYFQNIFSISVDDSVYNSQKFHSTTIYGGGAFDRGITTYIDISPFKNGLHELKVKIKDGPETKDTRVIIPFWLHKESFE
jgi:hypothetical protein